MWTRYDDRFTSARLWDPVSFEARWHYLALVEVCGSTGRYDGVLPVNLAARASDVPDPGRCHDEHIPPPGEREENLLPRKRRNTAAYRKRRCEAGEHSRHCPADTCPVKLSRRDMQRDVTPDDAGLPHGLPATPGRDGTGRAVTQDQEQVRSEEEQEHAHERANDDPWSATP
jgi:hypothetical protein